MPKKENINSRNIKYLEIQDHNGSIETYFKSSGKWYNVNHTTGYVDSYRKVGFKEIDNIISEIQGSHSYRYRIFGPAEVNEYENKTPPPSRDHVFYDIKMGNPHFFYGEDGEKEITARQIVQRYNKLKKEDF